MKNNNLILKLPMWSRIAGGTLSLLVTLVAAILIFLPSLAEEIFQDAPFFVLPCSILGFFAFMVFIFPPCLFGYYPAWMMRFIPRAWLLLYIQNLFDYYKNVKSATLSGATLSEYLEKLDHDYEQQLRLLEKK